MQHNVNTRATKPMEINYLNKTNIKAPNQTTNKQKKKKKPNKKKIPSTHPVNTNGRYICPAKENSSKPFRTIC